MRAMLDSERKKGHRRVLGLALTAYEKWCGAVGCCTYGLSAIDGTRAPFIMAEKRAAISVEVLQRLELSVLPMLKSACQSNVETLCSLG